jgi:hypothetical protein
MGLQAFATVESTWEALRIFMLLVLESLSRQVMLVVGAL